MFSTRISHAQCFPPRCCARNNEQQTFSTLETLFLFFFFDFFFPPKCAYWISNVGGRGVCGEGSYSGRRRSYGFLMTGKKIINVFCFINLKGRLRERGRRKSPPGQDVGFRSRRVLVSRPRAGFVSGCRGLTFVFQCVMCNILHKLIGTPLYLSRVELKG